MNGAGPRQCLGFAPERNGWGGNKQLCNPFGSSATSLPPSPPRNPSCDELAGDSPEGDASEVWSSCHVLMLLLSGSHDAFGCTG